MSGFNETDDRVLNKRKDSRDILLGYALMLPTVLGIVRASTSSELLKYRDIITEWAKNGFGPSGLSGQKILSRVLTAVGSVVEPENTATATINETKEQLRIRRVWTAGKLGESARLAATIAAETATGDLLRNGVIQPETVGLRHITIDWRRAARSARYELGLSLKNETPSDVAPELLQRADAIALAYAYQTMPGQSTHGMTTEEIRATLKKRPSGVSEITDLRVLKRYTEKLRSMLRDLTMDRLMRPAPTGAQSSTAHLLRQTSTPLLANDVLLRQTSTPLLINGVSQRSGTKTPLDTIIQAFKEVHLRGIIDDSGPNPIGAIKKLEEGIKAQKKFLGVNNMGDLWDQYHSSEVQAKAIRTVYNDIDRKVKRLGRLEGSVYEGATVSLVADEHLAAGIKAKYFKIVIKTRHGSPVELPLPTTQMGYTFLRPGVLPMNTRLQSTGASMLDIQGASISAIRRLSALSNKILQDYTESQSGTKASKSWLRMLDTLLQSQSPATMTTGDWLKQGTVENTGIKLLSGLGSMYNYKAAFEGSSILRSWRNATTLAGVKLFSYDTEFMSPGGYVRSAGSILSEENAQVWQLAFDVIDPTRKKAISNAGEVLYIRPNNWSEIRNDVRMFLLDRVGGSEKTAGKRVDDVLKTIDALDSKTSLREALKKIEKYVNPEQGTTLFLGQFHTESDIKNLVRTIRQTLPRAEAKAWLERLSPMFNQDLGSAGHRQIDIMKLFRGLSLGQGAGVPLSNSAIFKQLYGGLGADEFAELLQYAAKDRFRGDRESIEKYIRKIMASGRSGRDQRYIGGINETIVKNTWKAYRAYVSAGFAGDLQFTAHIEARYDEIITAMNAFKLLDQVSNPTIDQANSMVLMESAADIHRQHQVGYGLKWDTLHSVYERAEYAYMMRDALHNIQDDSRIDPATGMLKSDKYPQLDIFGVTHRQASLGRAMLPSLERLIPGGFLNNMLRTKFQVYNTKMLTINPVGIFNPIKLSAGAASRVGGSAYRQLGTFSTGNPYSTVVSHITRTSFAEAVGSAIHVPKAWSQKGNLLSDSLRIPTLLLPETLGIVSDSKIYIKDRIAKSVLIHGYGGSAAIATGRLHLPMNLAIQDLRIEFAGKKLQPTIADLFRRLQFDPRITAAFEGQALFNPDGTMVSGIQTSAINPDAPIAIRPGARFFGDPVAKTPLGSIDDTFDEIMPVTNNDQLYRGKVKGEIVSLTFNPDDATVSYQIARPSTLSTGAKVILGDTMVNKAMFHSTISSSALGFRALGLMSGYRFGGARDELGSLLEIQINRVLDKIHNDYKWSFTAQKQALIKALRPLFGDAIGDASTPNQGVEYPAVLIDSIPTFGPGGVHDGNMASVRLTDKGTQLLYSKAQGSIAEPLFKTLEAAGINYNYVKRRFMEQTQDVLKTKHEQDAAWTDLMARGIRFFEQRIKALEEKLRGGNLSKNAREAILAELGSLTAQRQTLIDGRKGTGAVLYDPVLVKLSSGMSTLPVFESFMVGLPMRVAETAPYDFMRPLARRESRFGVPLGPSATSAYDAVILRNTIRMLEGSEAGSANEWIREIDRSFGGLRTSVHSPRMAMLAKNMTGLNIARHRLLYSGTNVQLGEVAGSEVISTLSDEGLQVVVDALQNSKTLTTQEFMHDEFNVRLSDSPEEWARELDEQLGDRADLHRRATQIESLAHSKKVSILDANLLLMNGRPVDIFSTDPNQAEAFSVQIKSLSKLKSTNQRAYKALEALAQDADRQRFGTQGLKTIFDDITFNLERDVLSKLDALPEKDPQADELLKILRASANFKDLKNRGDRPITALTLPKLTGALEPYQVPHSVGGVEGNWIVSGGIQRRVLETVTAVHELHKAQETLVAMTARVGDDQAEFTGKLKQEALHAMEVVQQRQSAVQRLVSEQYMQRILAPSISLVMHKVFTSFMPMSYGRLYGSFGVLPTLAALYKSMTFKDAWADGVITSGPHFPLLTTKLGYTETEKHSDFIRKATFTLPDSGQTISYVYDIRKSFYNLLRHDVLSDLRNPLFSASGEILFRGLGVNQTIVPYSAAKAFLQSEIVDRGGRLRESAIAWLHGVVPDVAFLNRQPVSGHNYYGVATSYVVPDELWKLMGWDTDVPGALNSAIYLDELTRKRIEADFDGDIGSITQAGKHTAKSIQMSNRFTATLLRQEIKANIQKGIQGDDIYKIQVGEFYISDARKELAKLVSLNDGKSPVVYRDTHVTIGYSLAGSQVTSIADSSISDLIPQSTYKAFQNVDYDLLRSMRIDDYISQQLVTGRIGAIHKFYSAQIMGYEESAYSQIANLARDHPAEVNQILEKRHVRSRSFAKEAQNIINFTDRLYAEPTTLYGEPIVQRLSEWSGRLQQEIGIEKKREVLSNSRGTINKFLQAARTFWYDTKAPIEEVNSSIDLLLSAPGNEKRGFLYYYYDPSKYGNTPFADLSAANRQAVTTEARDILRGDYAIRQVGYELGANDFRWSYMKRAAQGADAQLMTLFGRDMNVASAITRATAPWAKQMGFSMDQEFLLNQLSRGGSVFNRESAIEALQRGMKHLWSGAYKLMGENVKIAGLLALGAIALDPNANSMLLGDTPGRGGEEYDWPSSGSHIFKPRAPRIAAPSAPFLDKLRGIANLPTAAMPQLRRRGNRTPLPPRPSIRYTNRRKKDYNRINIGQAIRAAGAVAIS